ncbi:uncharacterized protein BDR25DRAFT_256533 [Lindgomyces ingoldianus]|uniref:Uncharacterized protein n=1 Tax=Lindgomyces ingoldianus TaxID=673940 RepID=A0ACB6R3I2_9PLEO|nr:uncharacterized protein BDR25DRAFT_256533 [Lindgomyces ingoldianus]KAF2473696.1 hypothetical protein BDR25DRAFT_256533 [Lindgomyces ingoldianus]
MQHSHCRLLELPREPRDEIYSWVLASTRVTFGEMPGVYYGIKLTINKSHPYSLALLYTCRQIKAEVRSHWISWVVFNFQTPESLLDTLTKLPTVKVAAIRHIRVNGRPVMLSLAHDDVYYRLAWSLKLVPHLQLDTLTVLGGSANNISGGPAQVDYNTLDGLIASGTGWKELYYITPNSSILSFQKTERFGQTYLRKPQPDTWRSALSQRDGPDSGASVIIYRSRTSIPGSIVNHIERETFEQVVAPQDLEDFAIEKDPVLTSPSEQHKEVFVVVKRGRDANITEASMPPYNQDYGIRALALNMTWAQVREYYTEGGDNDDESSFDGPGLLSTSVSLDTYGCNAHEIDWADSRDLEIATRGGQSEDWDECTVADLLRSRFV